jgi:hypothetical protein
VRYVEHVSDLCQLVRCFARHQKRRAGRMHWPTLLHSWLPFQEYDLYVVAAQECQSEIVASLHSPEKSEWEAKIRGTIGSKYDMVASETMGANARRRSASYCLTWSHCPVEQVQYTSLLSSPDACCLTSAQSRQRP